MLTLLQIKRGNGPNEIDYVDISSVAVGRIENIERYVLAEAPGRARRIVKHGEYHLVVC